VIAVLFTISEFALCAPYSFSITGLRAWFTGGKVGRNGYMTTVRLGAELAVLWASRTV